MGKGFLAGIIWGAVSSLLVVVAVSLNSDLPGPETANVSAPEGSEFTRAPAGNDLVLPATDPVAVLRRPQVVLPGAPSDPAPTGEGTSVDTSPAQVTRPAELAELPEQTGPERAALIAPVEDEAPNNALPPVLPGVTPDEAPSAQVLDEALTLAEAQAQVDPVIGTQPDTPETPEVVVTPSDTVAAPEAAPDVAPVQQPVIADLPSQQPQPEQSASATTQAEGTSPLPEALDETAPERSAALVTEGRLPSISETATPVAPRTSHPPSVFTGALARNALQIPLEQGLPLFSVVLIDRSDTALPAAEIAGLPVPVAVAMDPGNPEAAQVAEGYRATGHEVLILAENLPIDGNEADLSLAVNGLLGQIPSAVGLLVAPGDGLGRNRAAMDLVAAILARTGHGLVIVPQGLNAAGQAAEAANVPTAEVFRVLDDEGQGVPLMSRYLNRAAFEASRDQSVVVLGSIEPNTIEALSGWVGGRRAATVAVAPISAIMLR